MFRFLSMALTMLALAAFVAMPAAADQKDDTHTGKFISATGKSFKMEHKDGKEHAHTLAVNAKVIGMDGKECSLTDFEKGQTIRVTTPEGDKTMATKVEALKRNGN